MDSQMEHSSDTLFPVVFVFGALLLLCLVDAPVPRAPAPSCPVIHDYKKNERNVLKHSHHNPRMNNPTWYRLVCDGPREIGHSLEHYLNPQSR